MRAFLGMGLLGQNFTRALLIKGEQVNVWNRTTIHATEMESFGGRAFSDIKDAVKNADFIHLALSDDDAVDSVLAAAEPAIKHGAIIADHTTTTVKGAQKRTEEWKKKGIFYQHAPVFMGPKNALESTGYMMVSGNQDFIGKIFENLAMMTGKLLNLGPETGKAAAMKLSGNLFLEGMTGAIADTVLFSKALGITTAELTDLFTQWNPGATVDRRLKKMTSEDFDNVSWKLAMARKDAGLFVKEAEERGLELNVIPGLISLMDKWIEEGYGNKDWTVIGKSGN